MCVKTDLFAAICAKADLTMATMLLPEDKKVAALLTKVVESIPETEARLQQLHMDDTSFWRYAAALSIVPYA
eukprot:SAG31_NODE_5216_length_2670_cov_1.605212_5_plen_72_part_00